MDVFTMEIFQNGLFSVLASTLFFGTRFGHAIAVEPSIIFHGDALPMERIPVTSRKLGKCSPHSLIYGTTYVDGRCPAVVKTENSYRAFVFDPESCQCFPIYTRGPCEVNQWIVAKDGMFHCAPNPCKDFFTGLTLDMVPFRGVCAELNKPHSSCGRFEHVRLAEDGITPKCILTSGAEENNLLRTIAAGVGRHKTLKCPDGERLSGDNDCYPIVTFQDLHLDLQVPSEVMFL